MCLSPEAGAVNTNSLLVMATLRYLTDRRLLRTTTAWSEEQKVFALRKNDTIRNLACWNRAGACMQAVQLAKLVITCMQIGWWKALCHRSGSMPTRVDFMALAIELLKDQVAASQLKRSLAEIFASSFQNLSPIASVILDETANLFW